MIKEEDNSTWKNKKNYFMNLSKTTVIFGITILLINSTIITTITHSSPASPVITGDIGWDVTFNFQIDNKTYWRLILVLYILSIITINVYPILTYGVFKK